MDHAERFDELERRVRLLEVEIRPVKVEEENLSTWRDRPLADLMSKGAQRRHLAGLIENKVSTIGDAAACFRNGGWHGLPHIYNCGEAAVQRFIVALIIYLEDAADGKA